MWMNEWAKRYTNEATSATTVAAAVAGEFYANVDYIELRFRMAMVCDNA